MKLAIVRQKYTPFGGAERFIERALGDLATQGIDVSIVTRKWPVNVSFSNHFVDPFYLGRTWRDYSFSREVQKIITRRSYDLVQSHERIPGCHIYRAGDGIHSTWLALRTLDRNFSLNAKLSPWHYYTLMAEEAMFQHPNLAAVICNSRMVRDDISKRFNINTEKLHVIYNGVDLNYFHPGLRDEHRLIVRNKLGIKEKFVVLFIGSGYKRKGLLTLIAAFSQIPEDIRNHLELWVVGYDIQQSDMKKQAMKFGLSGHIRFFGAQEDVRPFYGAADLFALPTFYDPFPNAALEALACGLPIIVSSNCGIAELVTDTNGMVIAANDVVALADAIYKICSPNSTKFARDAIRNSISHLSFVNMAQHFTTLYKNIT